MSCSLSVMVPENAESVPHCQPNSFGMTFSHSADKIPHMSETIHDRIRERMAELGLNPSSTSLKAGLSREAVRKLLGNEEQMPGGKTLTALARALDTTEQWLLSGDAVQRPAKPELRSADVEMPLRHEMPKDVPVMGTAAGSHLRGAFQLYPDPVDYVRRPPTLINAKNIYSLYIEGESMVPQYHPGDLVFVHPDKPARFGDPVVIQCQLSAEGGLEATIGIFLKRSTEFVTIQKHNPSAEIDIPRDTIAHMHKVLTPNEIYGV